MALGKLMKKKIYNLINKKNKSKIVSLTAYSKNIATILDDFCDLTLVGDSLGSVLYNYKSTREVTLNAMIEHSKSVRMGIKKSLMVVDMPHNTYRTSKEALKNAKKIVSDLNGKVDIVIVSFHAGGEGENFQHISNKNEIYLGENRGNPYLFARQMIDEGADIILGHGPHVTRAIDIYKNKFIAYSLGNFATYGRFNLRGPKGISPIVEIKFDGKGDFISGKITSIKLINRGIPVIDNKNSALKVIKDLVKEDLPNSTIKISDNGEFFKD